MALSTKSKQRVSVVLNMTKVVFHWGFMPAVLYLGFAKGADVGMPPLSVMNLLWQ
ncbi:mitochondrial import receptor subunit TOM7 homolog [Leptopilina heterotoma]|uniref:mitochondrial import receptor subunit TOM7 homolog n=1 Tax=Leptopilina heterotoma TaxID=63436 RepID=UPI001CA99A47|nr:mitochondrial import receptor subunit TOM7 homolog [Leptopilina heterotoma]